MSKKQRRRFHAPTEPPAAQERDATAAGVGGPLTSVELYGAARLAAYDDHDPKRAALFEDLARKAERREQGLPPVGEDEEAAAPAAE